MTLVTDLLKKIPRVESHFLPVRSEDCLVVALFQASLSSPQPSLLSLFELVESLVVDVYRDLPSLQEVRHQLLLDSNIILTNSHLSVN